MALTPLLDLRQSQSLVMTPQLQQAIRLLALSNVEIESYIADELERNPLLDVEREAPVDAPDLDGSELPRTSPTEIASDRAMSDASTESPLDDQHVEQQFNAEDLPDRTRVEEGAFDNGHQMVGEFSSTLSGDGPDFDSFASEALGLHEHLMDQARQQLSGLPLLIAGQLIGQIDSAGYVEANILELAYALNVSRREVDDVLRVIQTFDPVGVGARSLSECLAIQARDADRYDPAMATLIDNLDLVAKGALPQLRRLCGVDEEDMADMIRELRAYDPKPGLRFSQDVAQTIVPDIFVTQRGDGWAIEINNATLPRLLINRTYYTELSGGAQDKASKAWLSECLASANWLMRALDQRQKTIIKVATEIVKQQQAFFWNGVEHLRPLTLRAVADEIGMHESTVSRVTSNKYLSCARGTYELKYFFTSGIASADGTEAVSAEAVKSRIRALIQTEDPRRILSDDTLVEMLKGEGFDIARRTVAKYREAMGIGSSVQRRRQKALAG